MGMTYSFAPCTVVLHQLYHNIMASKECSYRNDRIGMNDHSQSKWNSNVGMSTRWSIINTSARYGYLASSVRTISNAFVQFFVPEKYLKIPWYNNCQFNFQQRCLTVMRKRFWSTINVQISQRSFDTKLKCWLQRNGLTNPGSGTSLVLKWQIFLIFWCTHNRFNLESNSCKENQVC